MLAYLMSHAGETITAQELLDEVWPNENASTDLVWMYISFLRGKLQSVQANVTIAGGRDHLFQLKEI